MQTDKTDPEAFEAIQVAPVAVERVRKPIQVQVEPLLGGQGGVKVSLPQRVAKNPRWVAKIFREQNVLEQVSLRSEAGKSKGRNSMVSFTICPVVDGKVGAFCSIFVLWQQVFRQIE